MRKYYQLKGRSFEYMIIGDDELFDFDEDIAMRAYKERTEQYPKKQESSRWKLNSPESIWSHLSC